MSPAEPQSYREVAVVGVRVDLPSKQPLVLLEEVDSDRRLPVWIGVAEAQAIAGYLQGWTSSRPLTHELLIATVAALGARVEGVRIVSVEGTVFAARLDLGGGRVIDARASDAIAVSLVAEVPLLVSDTVLEEAGVVPEGEDAAPEEQVEEFRHFLEEIDPSDFG